MDGKEDEHKRTRHGRRHGGGGGVGKARRKPPVSLKHKRFEDLPLTDGLKRCITTRLNFETMTKPQQLTIPLMIKGEDVMLRSATGTGKTLAYAVPIVHDLQNLKHVVKRSDGPLAVVLCPTRELAKQSFDVMHQLLTSSVHIVPGLLTGGEKKKAEKARIRKGINIVVATPGRFLDHIETTKSLQLKSIRWLVLDEADRLMDEGFERDMRKILDAMDDARSRTNKSKRRINALVSATLTDSVKRLAKDILSQPMFVDAHAGSVKRLNISKKTLPTRDRRDEDDDGRRRGDRDGRGSRSDDDDLGDSGAGRRGDRYDRSDEDRDRRVRHEREGDDDDDNGDDDDDDHGGFDGDVEEVTAEAGFEELDPRRKASRRGEALKDAKTWVIPEKLQQQVSIVPCKQRLMCLTSVLKSSCGATAQSDDKVIVFVSCRDEVCFYQQLLNAYIHPEARVLDEEGAKARKGPPTTWKQRKQMRQKKQQGRMNKKASHTKRGSAGTRKQAPKPTRKRDSFLDDDDDSGQFVGFSVGGGGGGSDTDSDLDTSMKRRNSSTDDDDDDNDYGDDMGAASMEEDGEEQVEQEEEEEEAGNEDENVAGAENVVLSEQEEIALRSRIGAYLKGLRVFFLHGGMRQKERTQAYAMFSKATSGALICTDVAARGLDLPNVTHVVQLCAPPTVEDYVHRIGRTARSGRVGTSLLFLMPAEKDFVTDVLNEKGLRPTAVDSMQVLKRMPLAESCRDHRDLAVRIQVHFEYRTEHDQELSKAARQAYSSFIRAYATYPSAIKHIFHVSALHFGHIAKSFALQQAPKDITAMNHRRLTKTQMQQRKRQMKRSTAQRMKAGAWRALRQGTNDEFAGGPEAKKAKVVRPRRR